jgi:acyl dehydratase
MTAAWRVPEVGAQRASPLRFTQADFDEFARLSGDDNPIHVDPGYAAGTRFGATVAHGMLLFSRLAAEAAGWLGDAPFVVAQTLVFPSPTYAGADLTAELRMAGTGADGTMRVGERIVTSGGVETAVGETTLAVQPREQVRIDGSHVIGGAALEGLTVGTKAVAERCFTAADIAAWCTLVGDGNPRHRGVDPEVPAALLGGLISMLLGVELPGRGTGWLKQRFVYLRPVPAGITVAGRVEIVRIRPEKGLVNLRTTCAVDGEMVVDGEALVLAGGSGSG